MSKALMSQYESGLTMPPTATLVELAGKLGVSLNELVTGTAEAQPVSTKYLYPRSYENVILAASKRGRNHEDYHVEIEGTVPVPRAVIESRGWRVERLAVQPSRGMSMAPTINDGEPLVINLDDRRLISGRTYAIEDKENGLRVKRLYSTGEGRVRVVSDNPDKINFPDEFITPDTEARIVGRAYRLGDLYSGQL